MLLGSGGSVFADAVTHWNAIAASAVTTGRAGPVGALDLALVQAAVNDAVQSIEGRFEPYKVTIDGAAGSPSAAAAAAAHGRAAQEVVDARILLGIHFRFADDAARRQGQRVAHWAFGHVLRPARCPGH
jgi:hypothetical protein